VGVSNEVLIMKVTHNEPGIRLSEEEDENLIDQLAEEDTNITHGMYIHGAYTQDQAACQVATLDGQIETIRDIVNRLE